MIKIKRALISLSDKTGIVEFAQSLAGLGVEIISTGGTGNFQSARIRLGYFQFRRVVQGNCHSARHDSH